MAGMLATTRRTALRCMPGIALGALLALGVRDRPGAWADHAENLRAIEIEWLRYTDAAGRELGQIRPYTMLDISNHGSVATPEGQRDLWVNLRIRNTGDSDLVVEPAAFALWTASGYLYRPHELFAGLASADADDDVMLARLQEPREYLLAAEDLLTNAPIAPRAERFGSVAFRVPDDAWFAGLLFTPEQERVLVLADFRRTASVIID